MEARVRVFQIAHVDNPLVTTKGNDVTAREREVKPGRPRIPLNPLSGNLDVL